MPWKTRKRGTWQQKGTRFRDKRSNDDRPIFLLKKKVLMKGTFKKGDVQDLEPIKSTSVGRTDSHSCPTLHPAKEAQRKDLIKDVKGGTALEVFGGKGNVTKTVYAGKLDKTVLIDKDQHSLKQADKKLKGRIKRETVAADNLDWLENEMNPRDLKNLKVIDFDAYGSPADQIRAFFDNFPIRKSLFVAVTDGSKRYLGYVDSRKGRR